MKKLEALTPSPHPSVTPSPHPSVTTPPPSFTPVSPRGDSDDLDETFTYPPPENDLVVSTKDRAKRLRPKRRPSPETKWLIPDQLVEVKKDVEPAVEPSGSILTGDSSAPLRPPTHLLSQQPYQVKVVRKQTLPSKSSNPASPLRNRTSWVELEQMTPKLNLAETTNLNSRKEMASDLAEKSYFEETDGQINKKANRKHKRDQEKQMLKSQLPPRQPTQRPRSSEHRSSSRPRSKSKSRRPSEDLGETVLRSERYIFVN